MLKKLLLFLPLVLLVITACNPTLVSAPPGLDTQDTTPIRASSPPEVTTQETTPTQVNPTSPASNPWVPTARNTPVPDPKPPVLPPPFRDKPAATLEEELAWRKEMMDKGLISKEAPAYGPHKKGATVTIKGKQIKLPDDAYVDGFVIEVQPIIGKSTWETPYYIVVRGNSRAYVTANSGKILGENTIPGEENVFDFLKRALQ